MKFSGKVGFWLGDVETKPGVFTPSIEEREYTGELLKNNKKAQNVDSQTNDNLVMEMRVSIIADIYMRENIMSVRYITYRGTKLKVTSVSIGYPRVILDVGGIYNGDNCVT